MTGAADHEDDGLDRYLDDDTFSRSRQKLRPTVVIPKSFGGVRPFLLVVDFLTIQFLVDRLVAMIYFKESYG